MSNGDTLDNSSKKKNRKYRYSKSDVKKNLIAGFWKTEWVTLTLNKHLSFLIAC